MRPIQPTEGGFAFEWFIPKGGFVAENINNDTRSEKSGIFIHCEQIIDRTYQPLSETPDLFHRLRKLNPTIDAAYDFASQYGTFESVDHPLRTGRKGFWADEFATQIDYLRGAWRIWEAINEAQRFAEEPPMDIPSLRDRIVYVPGEQYTAVEILSTIQKPSQPWLFNAIGEGNYYGAALALLENRISTELFNETYYSPEYAPRGRATTRGPSLHMKVFVKSLKGAIWLQFAQVVTGGVEWRICETEGCDVWFPVGQGYSRPNRRTCSPACRQKNSRGNR